MRLSRGICCDLAAPAAFACRPNPPSPPPHLLPFPQFTVLFNTAIETSERASLPTKRAAKIVETLTQLTCRYVSMGLYEKDKLLFLMLVSMKVLSAAGLVEQADVSQFLRGGIQPVGKGAAREAPAVAVAPVVAVALALAVAVAPVVAVAPAVAVALTVERAPDRVHVLGRGKNQSHRPCKYGAFVGLCPPSLPPPRSRVCAHPRKLPQTLPPPRSARTG